MPYLHTFFRNDNRSGTKYLPFSILLLFSKYLSLYPLIQHIIYQNTFKVLSIMNNCADLYFLSTIACKLSECLSEDELSILATSLTALGDMLGVIIARQAACKNKD